MNVPQGFFARFFKFNFLTVAPIDKSLRVRKNRERNCLNLAIFQEYSLLKNLNVSEICSEQ
ncbi:hypothetical protein ACU8KH_06647 [Lachancea thermotolerans]